jgi:peptidoglycan/xylan/chitin deacetylase (PgdA/CDA1 family)
VFKQYAKSALFSLGGSHFGRFIGRSFRGKGAILCYHRVLPDNRLSNFKNPNRSMEVSTFQFEKQLNYIVNKYKVISLDDFLLHIKSNSDSYYLAITFDDGYIDNYTHALPLLEKYKIPATIYITTQFPENKFVLWWYEIWEKINENNSIQMPNKNSFIKMRTKTYSEKRKCFDLLRDILMNATFEDQKRLIDNLMNGCNRYDSMEQCLNWEKIQKLSKNTLIEIGAHTHGHYRISNLSDVDVMKECSISKQILEKKIDKEIKHFAFPFGKNIDASIREYNLIKKLNFVSAVTTQEGMVTSNSSYFSLPRIEISGKDSLHAFMGKINGWSNLFSHFFK